MEIIAKHIDAYMKWMYNHWDLMVCRDVYGDDLGNHIWNKWVGWYKRMGVSGAISEFWFNADPSTRNKVLERIVRDYKL